MPSSQSKPVARWKRWLRSFCRKCLYLIVPSLAVYYLLPFAFPIPEKLIEGPASSVLLKDRDGEPLDHLVRSDYYRHHATSLDEIPLDLIHATLAAEDHRFYQHGGIDFRASARALRDRWELGRFTSGASTVTQQAIKLGSEKRSRNFRTKVTECLTARHFEMKYDKEEILTSYFNHLDYGNLIQGPLQASRHYFGKPLHQLSLAECALLAGLPQAPSRLNPRRNPEGAIKRRNWVLGRMERLYQTPEDRIQLAIAEPLQLSDSRASKTAPHLSQIMRQSANLDSQEIQSSLSADLQRDTLKIVRSQLAQLKDKHIQDAAVVIIYNQTGEILTLIGSPDFNNPNNGQIDATRVLRSPGSALKPFTYLLAYEQGGMSPATIVKDIPTPFADERSVKEFVNYDRTFRGPVTIHHALANSLNVPAIRTLNAIGGASALKNQLNEFGITSLDKDAAHYGLGLTLGSGAVSLLELTNAYASLARMGEYRPTTFILNDHQKSHRVATYQSTWMLAQTMSDNITRSESFGNNSFLRLPFPCAVKTGTSTDFRDNWCLGFTAEFTVGVWAGNLDNTPMRGISGVTGAGAIFQQTMLRLHRDKQPSWFTEPVNMISCHIDNHTGKRLSEAGMNTVTLILPKDRIPTPAQASDKDNEQRVYLDETYKDWLVKHGDKSRFQLIDQQPTNQSNQVLQILSPSVGAEYLLDPDLPNMGNRLILKTNYLGDYHWSCETLTLETNNGETTATLKPGKHTITLKNSLGKEVTRIISVREL